ncbi:MAG: hypothetical protein QQN41_04725 [Nitrosopumilus sp.]
MIKSLSSIALIAIIGLTFNIDVNGQKCKYQLDKKDPMTGERVRRTEVKIKNYFVISFYRKSDTYRVELNVRFVGERNFAVPKGEKLNLKLKDGSILTMECAQNATPVSYVTSSQVMTLYAMSYICSKEDLQKIANTGFSVASAKVGNETLTYEVKEKEIPKTAQKAKCILIN